MLCHCHSSEVSGRGEGECDDRDPIYVCENSATDQIDSVTQSRIEFSLVKLNCLVDLNVSFG